MATRCLQLRHLLRREITLPSQSAVVYHVQSDYFKHR